MPDLEDAFGPTFGGLDRGSMDVYTPINAHAEDQASSASSIEAAKNASDISGPQSNPTEKISRMSKKLRSKLHIKTNDVHAHARDQEKFNSSTLAPTLAPSPPKTSEEDRFGEAPPRKPKLPPAQKFITNPVQTGRTIVNAHGGNDLAENLAKTDTTHEASVKLVRAFDELQEAKTDSEEKAAIKQLEILKAARQDSFVRWTIDRHIHKVSRVQASPLAEKPMKDFITIDENGREVVQWAKYGNHLFLFYLQQYGGQYIDAAAHPSNASADILKAAFERVFLASVPLQRLFMRMRSVAHWERPPESVAYMTTYLVLFYYDLLVSAGLLLTLILVIRRHYLPSTMHETREYLELSEDRDRRAADLSQHIERYGGHRWVDALIERAGPATLLQLDDLADFLEVLRNFYEWRDPTRTAFSLGAIAVLWLLVTFLPLWLLVKSFFFSIGFTFFVLTPIAHRHPRHRLLLSPLIWMFWKVPTHAQWAVARLKAEAAQNLATLPSQESTPTNDSFSKQDKVAGIHTRPRTGTSHQNPHDIGRYHCFSEKHSGNLCLSTDGVSFQTIVSTTRRWQLRFEDMQGIEKVDSTVAIRPGDDIIFRNNDGRELQVTGLKDRDIVFSQIIGYSNVGWQRTG